MNQDHHSAAAASTPSLDGMLAVRIDRLSEISGVGKTTIYAEAKAGRLRIRKVGRRAVVTIDDARAWLNAL